jgi:sporulation protein YlmC with PRC-barrel domain
MEKNELSTRDKLKAYFETGKYPTENQFSDLIDSLRLKEDVLTNNEMAILANRLATMENGYIIYSGNNTKDLKFPIVVSSKNEEDQLFTISNTDWREEKRYFLGSAPYSITTKEFPAEGLGENEYYYINCQIDGTYGVNRLFGNNLITIPDGFDLGTVEDTKFQLQLSKQDLGQKVKIVNTNIKLVNKTEVSIQYAAYSTFWSNAYTSEDVITDHYDLWDSMAFWYKSDLRGITQSIECKAYDADNNTLLMTGVLLPGQNNQNVWSGGIINGIRNLRIECEYMSK